MEPKKTFDLVVNGFTKFDPLTGNKDEIPNAPGNHIMVLREGTSLPEIGIEPIYTLVDCEGCLFRVIYTGLASESLQDRAYEQQFTGNNAGRSTLRKSLGSLMGFKKIPRDKNKLENGKTKFEEQDEATLSAWMKSNLILFYKGGENFDDVEKELIRDLNPPLNIQNNKNKVNEEYRNKLSYLRTCK